MLATLERPLDRSAGPARTATATRAGITTRHTVLAPPEDGVVLLPVLPALSVERMRSVPDAAPIRSALHLQLLPVPRDGDICQEARRPKLRLTVRARRLLAGLILLCTVGVGVVAVDVLSAVIPDSPATSYPGQVAPYDSSAEAAADGLVPASGASIVVVQGDTLWSVAQRVAPGADPRSFIAAIMTVNGLDSPSIQAGQVLRLP